MKRTLCLDCHPKFDTGHGTCAPRYAGSISVKLAVMGGIGFLRAKIATKACPFYDLNFFIFI